MLNVILGSNMKIENIFTLGFGFSDVYISNKIIINKATGAITSASVALLALIRVLTMKA